MQKQLLSAKYHRQAEKLFFIQNAPLLRETGRLRHSYVVVRAITRAVPDPGLLSGQCGFP